MHQIRFHDPAGGAYSAPPDPLAGFEGPTSRGWEGGGGKGGEGKGGEGRQGKGRGKAHEPPPHYLEAVYAYVHASIVGLVYVTATADVSVSRSSV